MEKLGHIKLKSESDSVIEVTSWSFRDKDGWKKGYVCIDINGVSVGTSNPEVLKKLSLVMDGKLEYTSSRWSVDGIHECSIGAMMDTEISVRYRGGDDGAGGTQNFKPNEIQQKLLGDLFACLAVFVGGFC